MASRENVLLIYCSDGRGRKPHEIRGNVNHAIRLPGGLLFPNLCASSLTGDEQTFEMSAPISRDIKQRINLLLGSVTPSTGFAIGELVLLLAIETMVRLKNPTQIILMYHSYCGAADSLRLGAEDIRTTYLRWKDMLGQHFPLIPITVTFDSHSSCGAEHFGHEVIAA